jgi:cytochrome c oxidase assembly factor CtaG
MAQYESLVWIAAPLLLLGARIWPLWRALPLSWRRSSLRWLLGRRWSRQTLTWHRRMGSKSLVAWLLFLVVFLGWRLLPVYDLALEHEAIHALEHLSFLGAALILWAQVIPSFPLRARLSYPKRAGYLFGAALVMHVVANFIDIAATPIYPFYGSGPNVIAMQSATGAIMDLSSQVEFIIGILTCLWLWLRQDERAAWASTREEAVTDVERAAAATATASGALLIAEADLAEAREAQRADATDG